MEERINVAELLKDCPKGMELDCVLYNDITLHEVVLDRAFPIVLKRTNGDTFVTTKYGQYQNTEDAKCVIFPKGKTTWEGFQRPFKDGDVVTNIEGSVIIYKGITTHGFCGSFVSLDRYNQFIPHYESYLTGSIRLSTEEEKEKLFKAIKDNGYKWNAETKTLEKLIIPKFKVGNRVKKHKDYISGIVTNISDDGEYKVEYQGGGISYINPAYQDEWELVHDKFDITTLKPFDKVLVRDENLLEDSDITDATWSAALYSHNKFVDNVCPYVTTNGHFAQCVPYKCNEHLLGTTDDCDEYYKTWE